MKTTEVGMSLVVSAFWNDLATGELREFTDWDDGHHMAGVERARTDLWGSESVRRRGAKFLPKLAESNLWVSPDELPEFIAEVRALLAEVDKLRAELGRDPDCTLSHYLTNFLRAAEYATVRSGGVNIT
ncbi:MAG: hypothetical protein QM703_11295 [Gemmatales bacterium]